MLFPGLPLKLTTENPLYRGTLDSVVITVDDSRLVVSAPLQNGRLTLLPVGTILRVRPAGSPEEIGFQSEIIDRTFQPQRTLSLTLPHAVSRGGRSAHDLSTARVDTARVIAVSSGKGGVGKTTMAINLGLALCRRHKRVCLIDVDLGTANVEFLLGLKAPYNISHLLNGEKEIDQILAEGPEGLIILPGSSGLENLANLSDWQFTRLVNSFNRLDRAFDLVILDTGAGISANVTNFLMAADEILLVTTPDPHAVLDAYALIKTIARRKENLKIRLIVNRVERPADEARVKLNLLNTCREHLRQPLEFLGSVPESQAVSRSIREMTTFIEQYPASAAAASVEAMARRFCGDIPAAAPGKPGEAEQKGLRRFIDELQKLFSAGG